MHLKLFIVIFRVILIEICQTPSLVHNVYGCFHNTLSPKELQRRKKNYMSQCFYITKIIFFNGDIIAPHAGLLFQLYPFSEHRSVNGSVELFRIPLDCFLPWPTTGITEVQKILITFCKTTVSKLDGEIVLGKNYCLKKQER